MKSRIAFILLIILIPAFQSCVSEEAGTSNETEPGPYQGSNGSETIPGTTVDGSADSGQIADPEPAPPDIPFYLIIDGMTVPDDLELIIHSEEAVEIQFIASSSLESELVVMHPDGSSIPLGTWTGDNAAFHHSFPYGENHLVIKWGETVYDILVVSAAPGPSESSSGCEDNFLNAGPDSVWFYEQTINQAVTTSLTYRTASWSESSDGVTAFSILMSMEGGVEENPAPVTTLDIYCEDNILYITRAVEQSTRLTWTTIYNDSTIYMPTEITHGATWERHGIITTEGPEGTMELDLVESMRCIGEEHVAVAAGEFIAYKIEYTIERTHNGDNLNDTGTSWFVPGIGRILSISADNSKRLELISFNGIIPELLQAG